MKINVVGYAKKEVLPDEVEICFTFNRKSETYEGAVELGTKSVDDYLKFLKAFGFQKDEFKTCNLRVSENKEYDESKRKYVSVGYVYTQTVKLKFDYDVKILADIMEQTSKLEFAPEYTVRFDVKNKDKLSYELYGEAVADAKNQAEIIAKASGLNLSVCKRISTNLTDNAIELYSETSFNGERMMCKSAVSNMVQNNFTPEEITVETKLYVIWEAV